MILLTYRHGLRASELGDLRVGDLDLQKGTIYCRREKGSISGLHPMKEDEVAAVKSVLGDRKVRATDCVFQSDRSEQMTRSAVWRVMSLAGERAGLSFPVYAHQLRHACGYYLANKGYELRLIQEYLGHKYIQNTVRYARLNPARFEGLW
jgi:site-specific recombinase XerD